MNLTNNFSFVNPRPAVNLTLLSNTKLLKTIKFQLKKKKFYKLIVKKTKLVKWLENPFCELRKSKQSTRLTFARLKKKFYFILLRKYFYIKIKTLKSRSKFVKKNLRNKKKKKKGSYKKQLRRTKFSKNLKKRKKKALFARFMSKNQKFIRYYKGKNKNVISKPTNNSPLCFGTAGFVSLKSARLKPNIFYNSIFILKKFMRGRKKKIKTRKYPHVWMFFKADLPVSAKPKNIRMGKGKGDVKFWIARLSISKKLFEFNSISFNKTFFLQKMFKKTFLLPTNFYFKLPKRWSYFFKIFF